MRSINPATNALIGIYPDHEPEDLNKIITGVHACWETWKETSYEYRSSLFRNMAGLLRHRNEEFARLITGEMGKIIRESRSEVGKCAIACDYFAEQSEQLLKDQVLQTDASETLVVFQPLGVILAVMPWNFPFWQVFRFAVPALMAGNTAVLKHASNVPGCALTIEQLFRDSGFPENVFRTLMIPAGLVEPVIGHPLIAAATLTGSEDAGSRVASIAGANIKKTVLELGGSDAFIVLEDADIDLAAKTGLTARMINQGQSCIAAKRFIVLEPVADEFTGKLKTLMEGLMIGNPEDPQTDVGPLARPDLVDAIERQVNESVRQGAILVTGGKRPETQGAYFQPTLLDRITRDMPVFREETFGPVAAVIRVGSVKEAIAVANDSRFGLGGSVFTKDIETGKRIAREIETGALFVNGLVKSDPRMPFGGVKRSGYGRELSEFGIREFVNVKTIWIR